MDIRRQFHTFSSDEQHFSFSRQQTVPLPVVTPIPPLPPLPSLASEPLPPLEPPEQNRKAPRLKHLSRFVAAGLALVLAGALYVVWFAPTQSTPSNGVTAPTYSGTATPNSASDGNLHDYVTGAIYHPGVYTLPPGARVYQLLQAAGGAKPEANLVALNLAAPLTDGEEVYVLSKGEIPPSYMGGVSGPGASGTAPAGQLVNINTASADQMRQQLHVSSATAQKIIDYRTQHGPYTSIDQLLQVVSKSIYDHIKNLITV